VETLGRKSCLLHSHRRSPSCGCFLPLPSAALAVSADGMDLGRGGDIVHLHLAPDDTTAQSGTPPMLCRSSYGVMSKSWTLVWLGRVPTANLLNSCLPYVPILCLLTSMWTSFIDWMMGRPPQCQGLIVPTDCSSWDLQLRIPLENRRS
jgi:hypothetical protein